LNSKIVALLNYVIVNQIMMLLLLWKQYYSMAPIVLMMSVAAINYLQWRWKRSHRHRRSRVVALDFNIVAPLNYVIVDQIMMLLLLWRRHYLMAPIVLMMSAAAIN
jgi:hypothetical protein